LHASKRGNEQFGQWVHLWGIIIIASQPPECIQLAPMKDGRGGITTMDNIFIVVSTKLVEC